MRLPLAGLAVGMALCWTCGCQQSTQTGTADGDETGKATVSDAGQDSGTTQNGGRGRTLRLRANVDAYPGKWALILPEALPDRSGNMTYREICLALLEFVESKDGSGLTGNVLATVEPDRLKLEFERLAVDGPRIEFVLHGTTTMEFRGALKDSLVRGSLAAPTAPEDGIKPALLKPTEEDSFRGWDPFPFAPGIDIFSQAIQQKDQPASMLRAAQKLRGNPLSLVAYQGILGRLHQFPQLDEAQLREIMDGYAESAALWGPSLEWQARMNAAAGVTSLRRFPKLARDLVDRVTDRPADYLQTWDNVLKHLREQVQIDLALEKMQSADEAVQAEGFAELQERLPLQRYNPEILGALGEFAHRKGQLDLAEQYLGDIVALPILENMWLQSRQGQPPGELTPRERLLKIREERQLGPEGLDAFLEDVYRRRIAELLDQARTSGPEPVAADAIRRTVLVELFTGTECPPCVAADLAALVLRETYAPSQVIVLQFHQHIPGPDPLCNQDSEDRFAYYEGQGTPTLVVDGGASPPVGGVLQHVSRVYAAIREAVDRRLTTPTDVVISATAETTDGQLHVQVAVEGVPDDRLDKVRLRLALVEDTVHYAAANGVREHHGVVREMLGGAKGTGAKSGKLGYSVVLPVAEIKQHLVDYLTQFEIGRGITFPDKPLALQPLSLVAWVQDESTQEVLQAAVVPVAGTLELPADSVPSAVNPANKD
uniref:Thioredoxin domain-containing protein n=1 Tax=Schlesneria paludicola TaxID=360056 RepID=A0A7C4QRW8_9PLAN